jgi:hypothetical protein
MLFATGRSVELLIAVGRRGLIDHRTGSMEGLVLEGVEALDRREPRLDGAHPHLSEALGLERLSCRGEQRCSIDRTAAGGSYYCIYQAAAGSSAEMRHALLLDQVLCGVSSCADGTCSISAAPRCEASADLAEGNVVVVEAL